MQLPRSAICRCPPGQNVEPPSRARLKLQHESVRKRQQGFATVRPMIGAILVAGLLQGSVYALISIGLTLMFGILRVVNFAHGDLLMVAMYLTYVIGWALGWDPLLAILLTVPLFL